MYKNIYIKTQPEVKSAPVSIDISAGYPLSLLDKY